jgi:hypothetical protein
MAFEEKLLPLSEFRIQSNGIDDSGSITVEGTKDPNGFFTKLTVNAFGKTFDVSVEGFRKFPFKLKPQNGIQLSYKKNSKQEGGKTVYISFLSGGGAETKNAFMLLVSEDGNQEIYIRQP